ncbi:MAG: radical SAM protein [Spirochaetales bacterium]|nr:radical SAM protein [Spirochaetales bacterium]
MPGQEYKNVHYAYRDSNGNLYPPFPVDPVKLTGYTQSIVCREIDGIPCRKYTDFYAVGVYGGIATAYSVGCNFRCIFCWVDWSRDWPEKYGHFYSPRNVYTKLRQIMKSKGLRKARISGAESTICPHHLCEVLKLVHKDADDFDLFVIETNGIVISQEKTLASRLEEFASKKNTQTVGHVRLSIRGGLPDAYTAKTGCIPESVDLPFIAAERLWKAGVSFHVAVVVDQRFTSTDEKKIIYDRLYKINPSIRYSVEEEYLDPYPHALVRLRAAGRVDVTGKSINKKEQTVLLKRPPL